MAGERLIREERPTDDIPIEKALFGQVQGIVMSNHQPKFDASGEPLRKLLTYRRGPKGVTFGQNLIPRGLGVLRIGDRVEVLA